MISAGPGEEMHQGMEQIWIGFEVKAEETVGAPSFVGFSVSDSPPGVASMEQWHPDESSLLFSVLRNSLVKWLHFSNTKGEWGLIFGSQPPSLSLSCLRGKYVAASYSLDTFVTSSQYFPESKPLSTLLRKTTQARNASVPKNRSPTKEEKCLSSSQRFMLSLKRKVR